MRIKDPLIDSARTVFVCRDASQQGTPRSAVAGTAAGACNTVAARPRRLDQRILAPAMLLVTILACALLGGCATLHTGNNADQQNLAPVTKLLFYSRALMHADTSGRYTMLSSARDTFEDKPTAAHAARLALAFGQPGHKGYSPRKCRNYADKALSLAPDHWGSAAATYLRQLAALCDSNAQTQHRLADARAENRRLTAELMQLHEKIKALTRLEAELSP